MTDREKLLDLICGSPAVKCEYPTGDCKSCNDLVDCLISNGVVISKNGNNHSEVDQRDGEVAGW